MKRYFKIAPLVFAVGAAQAQVPDAGALQQQIDKTRGAGLPQAGTQPPPAAPALPDDTAGPRVVVERFRFVGNSVLGSAELEAALAQFKGRSLSFGELQRAALAVSGAYRQAGWVARAYLPRQELEDGIVTIQVVEARFGGVRVDGRGRIDLAQAEAIALRAQPRGALIKADALDRAILLTDDLPGVSAIGNLAPGEGDNETALALVLSDEALLSGDASADNFGARATGAPRANLGVFLNSPLRRGDLGQLNLMRSEGNEYGRVGYSLPLGSAGWRAGLNASALRYRLVADEFAALRARGSSDTAGLEASYPLLRSRLSNLYLQLNYDARRFDNSANDIVSSHYRVDGLSIGLSGNRFDQFGGGGNSSANLQFTRGKVDLDGSPNAASDALTTRSAGHFSKLRYGISRQQALSEHLSIGAAVSGQAAGKNLDSSEKFYLGGYYGVRAYPASEAGGSSGQLLNLELRARLPARFSASAFYDWGQVTVNRDNAFQGAAELNRYSLKGAGLALGWTSPFKASFQAVWARRIGANPNPTLNGSDQDGSLRKNRFWLQATLPF